MFRADVCTYEWGNKTSLFALRGKCRLLISGFSPFPHPEPHIHSDWKLVALSLTQGWPEYLGETVSEALGSVTGAVAQGRLKAAALIWSA